MTDLVLDQSKNPLQNLIATLHNEEVIQSLSLLKYKCLFVIMALVSLHLSWGLAVGVSLI